MKTTVVGMWEAIFDTELRFSCGRSRGVRDERRGLGLGDQLLRLLMISIEWEKV